VTGEQIELLDVECLGAFAKLPQASISFAMSVWLAGWHAVHPSIFHHGTIWLPLDGFSRNLMSEYFLKLCQETQSMYQLDAPIPLLFI
jgi:hypothetical protein